MSKNKILYLDVETSGLDVNKHGICTLAATAVVNGEEVGSLDLKINPESYIEPKEISDLALQVNGLTRDQLKGFGNSGLSFSYFIEFLDSYINKFDKNDKFTICGYNSQFDSAFLRAWFLDNGHRFYGSYFYNYDLDVYALVRWLNFAGKLNTDNQKLETVCKSLGIELEAHDARSDIEATRKLAKKLIEYFK